MLVRPDGDGALVIGQASHAWISGQLARAWGNERFGALEPREPICLAAEQHDIGWGSWDAEPELDPETGRPYAFTAMPLATHLELLTAGPELLLSQSRHAALMTSLHASALYGRRDLDRETPERAAQIRAFLDAHRRRQDELREMLRSDPATADQASDEWCHRQQRLLWTWDGLSLALLLDWLPFDARDVPTAEGMETLRVRWREQRRSATIDPWPFTRREPLTVSCEARRLTAPARSTAELRAALAAAPWLTLSYELTPA